MTKGDSAMLQRYWSVELTDVQTDHISPRTIALKTRNSTQSRLTKGNHYYHAGF